MEENMEQNEGPLPTLAGIAEVKLKLKSLEYMDLIRQLENLTNVGTDPDSKIFSIDIDNVKFIFTRD